MARGEKLLCISRNDAIIPCNSLLLSFQLVGEVTAFHAIFRAWLRELELRSSHKKTIAFYLFLLSIAVHNCTTKLLD